MIYNVLQSVSRMYKHTSVPSGVKALKLQRLQTINLSGYCCRVLLKLRHWQIIVDKCHRRCLWTCPSVQHKAWTKFIGDDQTHKNNKRNATNKQFTNVRLTCPSVQHKAWTKFITFHHGDDHDRDLLQSEKITKIITKEI